MTINSGIQSHFTMLNILKAVLLSEDISTKVENITTHTAIMAKYNIIGKSSRFDTTLCINASSRCKAMGRALEHMAKLLASNEKMDGYFVAMLQESKDNETWFDVQSVKINSIGTW